MRMTTKSRYAVRALVNLAMRDNGKPVSLSLIAKEEEISLNFLEQIFMALRKANIVRSIRGPAGGYILCRKPEDVSVAEVIRAVGEPIFPVKCVDAYFSGRKSGCPREDGCLTKSAWRELGETINIFLKTLTLGHILKSSSKI